MKKIDLHIHTVPTCSDSAFTFSLEKLKKYVTAASLNAIAITNHNTFDASQFRIIQENIDAIVFPGIEINLEGGHILVIGEASDLEGFEKRAALVSGKILQATDNISVEELIEIFDDLGRYLVIPHYGKNPEIKGETLARLSNCVSAGEVDCAKKFIRAIKDDAKLTPVLFSDVRISNGFDSIPTRQTYIDCGELTLSAIKACLQDKGKVALSENDGNSLFPICEGGLNLSTGLNVILGGRSSGKTYTLEKIYASNNNVKYIKQFSLVQHDDDAYERELQNSRCRVIDDYLSAFRGVLNDVMNIDLQANERAVDKYVCDLLKSAEEEDRKDAFSKAALFAESEYPISDDKTLYTLIEAVQHLIENVEYRSIIHQHLIPNALTSLVCELIKLLRKKDEEKKRKKSVNELVRDIKKNLKLRTSATQVDDVDLYRIIIEERKVSRFTEIVKLMQTKAIISEESLQGFRVIATKAPFLGAGEVRSISGVRAALSEHFQQYEQPYKYMRALYGDESITKSEIYKMFVNISHTILNSDGHPVSGGERSEFRLLQEIKDAQNYEMLLIDEPESSFDNMFLKSDVNQIIKEISESLPVVVVTHNSTLGASIGADYLVYARKELEGGNSVYRLYFGHPTDRKLVSLDGKEMNNHDVMLNSLEAGDMAYRDRRGRYEALKE